MRFKKPTVITMSAVVAIIVIGLIAWGIVQQNDGFLTRNSNNGCWNTGIETPDYRTLVPSGKTIEDLGDWRRISPKNNDPVYGYADSINNVLICVSQQKLPKSFEGKVSTSVAELAKGYNAKDTIDASGTDVYIGTNAAGPQSVIFSKEGLLVLIKSKDTINDTSWRDYVVALNLALY